jgi:hypothetical protein
MGYFAPELLGYIVAEWWRTFVGISINLTSGLILPRYYIFLALLLSWLQYINLSFKVLFQVVKVFNIFIY